VSKVSFTARDWLTLQAQESPVDGPFPTNPAELPYDWLFATAREPVLIVDATSEVVTEANSAACRLLGMPRGELLGAQLASGFDASNTAELRRRMALARLAGKADYFGVRTLQGGTDLLLSLSLARAASESFVLVRMAARHATDIGDGDGDGASIAFHAIESAPIGFLVTDSEFRVEYANQAFVDLVEIRSAEDARGKSLANWLEFSEHDMARLRVQMIQREAATVLRPKLRAGQVLLRGIEVHAVAVPDGQNSRWGFSIRELPRLN
jgi:PAS domain-containing protein